MSSCRITCKPRLLPNARLRRQRRFGLGFLLLALAARAGAQDGDPEGLQFATADGGWRDTAALDTDVRFTITGLVAQVVVEQRYVNDGSDWLEGRYLLPLPEGAAVGELKLVIGEREVVGEIHEKAQAQAIYQAAAAQGQRAGLVEQDRPNLFRTSVANVGPGETVSVRIAYWQAVDFRDGRFSIDLPLGLVPRYTPAPAAASALDTPVGDVPAATVAAIDDTAAMPVVSLAIDLTPGIALDRVDSPTHAIATQRSGERYHIRLADHATLPIQDFELRWTPTPQANPQSALFVETVGGTRYAYAMLMPPTQAVAPLPRELILVIDTSGSMQGNALEQAREALIESLGRLRGTDRFNLIQFNSVTEQLFGQPVPADAEHLRVASEWIAALEATGGTEMQPALQLALRGRGAPGFVRQVVFATDAGVSNENALLAQIERELGDARLFPIGIGSAPNGWFLRKAAEVGRGSETVIRSLGDVSADMQSLFAKLDRPALNDVTLAWPAGSEAYPAVLPDLYHGEPLLAVAKLAGTGGTLKASGWSVQGEWDGSLSLARATPVAGVARLWGRRKIESLEDALRQGADELVIRPEIVALGVEHHLVSRYTSLVAVERQVARPSDAALASTRFENGGSGDDLMLAQGATDARSLAAWAAALLLLGLALAQPRKRIARLEPA